MNATDATDGTDGPGEGSVTTEAGRAAASNDDVGVGSADHGADVPTDDAGQPVLAGRVSAGRAAPRIED